MDKLTKTSFEKLPPYNIEAEQAVLGAVLLDNTAIYSALEIFNPDDFYRSSHQKIFNAMLELSERGDAIDLLMLRDELERRKELEEIGGPAYLATLIDLVPTAANIEFHAKLVHEKSIARRLLNASIEIATRCYDETEDVSDVLGDAEQKIFSISEGNVKRGFTPISTIVKDSYAKIEELAERQTMITGLATGFTDLDYITSGLQPSDLLIIAARPAMGKTSFCMNIAQHIGVREQVPIAIFNLEMSKEQLGMRLLCAEARLDSHNVRIGQLQDEDWERLAHASEVLSKAPIYIDDTPAITAVEIRAKVKRLKIEKGLGVVMIDYLQLMQGKQRYENRQQEISALSRSLKMLAKELNVPVICLSQLSRAVEGRTDKRPQLSDLRESGCLAGDTQIYLPARGMYVPIRDMVGMQNFSILNVNPNTWELETAAASRVFTTGEKPVFCLTKQLGRTIQATANHKFLAIGGWKRLDELSQGERIALPRTLNGPKTDTLSDAEAALLGHLIGDGCTLPRHAVQYTTREKELADLVVQLAHSAFGSSVAPRISHEQVKKGEGWYQVYLSAAEHLTHGTRNPIAAWLDTLGIWGLRSHEKFVPVRIFQQSSENIAVFLRHVWSTDGCIHFSQAQKPSHRIYYATSSEQLAKDIQALLLRFSINARVHKISQGTKGRDQYHVSLSGKNDIARFSDSIGAVGVERKKRLRQIYAFMESKIPNTNRDVVPRDIWRQLVVPSMQEHQITSRAMQAKLGNAYCGTSLYKNNISRERASRVADIVQSEELKQLASSDVYWDRIVAIEEAGIEPVYDITVPTHHNFIANNIIVHNSIEQDADIVMFIYRPEVYFDDAPEGVAEIIIGKHRNGPVGSVQLAFIKDYTRFENLETHHNLGTMNAPGSMPVQPGDENPF